MPSWLERAPTVFERSFSTRPHSAMAIYWPLGDGVIISPDDWPLLVHEMVHHAQRWAGLPMDERQAEAAQARAGECRD